jgi:hypothetical protein
LKIRSITYFDDLQWPIDSGRILRAGDFIAKARKSFLAGGFEVQTTRLATPPFPLVLTDNLQRETVGFAAELETRLTSTGFDYISIGPALPDFPESYSVLPEVLANSQTILITFQSALRCLISRKAIQFYPRCWQIARPYL